MNRLRYLREQHEKTQQDIADFLHVSQKAVSFYELGQRDMPTAVLEKLASYFHVSIDYILCRTNNPKPNPTLGDYLRSARQNVAYSHDYVEVLTGIKADTILAWEKNAARPSEAELQKLAEVYHVSLDVLTGKDTSYESNSPRLSLVENIAADLYHSKGYYVDAETARIANEMKENPGRRVLFDSTRNLSPEKIKQVQDFVNFITRDQDFSE